MLHQCSVSLSTISAKNLSITIIMEYYKTQVSQIQSYSDL